MKMPVMRIICVAILILCCSAFADVTMFRGNPAHTGVIPDSPMPRPHKDWKWRFRTGNKVRSTPAVVNGVAYFGSDDSYLYALDVKTQELRWKFKTGAEVSSSPAVANGLVYFLSNDNTFYAVDVATGKQKWMITTGPELKNEIRWDYFISSPTVADNTIYFGGSDGSVYAIDALKGTKKWTFKTTGKVRASPSVADQTVFIGSMDGIMYALHAATGELKWKFKCEGNEYFPIGEIQSSAAVADGGVFFGSRDGHIYALEQATGKLRWKKALDNFSWVISSPAVADGLVVFGTSDQQSVDAHDAKTGERKWHHDVRVNVLGSPSISKGIVYIGDFYAIVKGLELQSGKPVTGVMIDDRVVSSPVLVDGVMYFGADDDYFYAVE